MKLEQIAMMIYLSLHIWLLQLINEIYKFELPRQEAFTMRLI